MGLFFALAVIVGLIAIVLSRLRGDRSTPDENRGGDSPMFFPDGGGSDQSFDSGADGGGSGGGH